MEKPLAEVYHLDSYGLRKDKYRTLLDNGINTLPWQRIECRAPEYFFVAKDYGVLGQYQQGFSVSELFPVNSSGIKTHRDDFVVDIDKNTLSSRIESFYSSSATNEELKNKLALNEKEEWIDSKRHGIFNKNSIKKIHYRPFDNRYIYYSFDLIERGREKVMQHFLKGENVGILFPRQAITEKFGFFVCNTICDINFTGVAGQYGAGLVFPLYLYPETTGQQSLQESNARQPNLNPVIVQQIAEKLGLTFTPEKSTVIPAGIGGDDSISSSALPSSMKVAGIQRPGMGYLNIPVTGYPHPGGYDAPLEDMQATEIRQPGDKNVAPVGFAPIDLLDYIYAVLHSPNYRETYKEFLKTDFPRIPYPDPHTFWPLVKLGSELRQLHLLGGEGSMPSAALPTSLWVDSPVVNDLITTYPMDGDNTVTRKINNNDFDNGKVWINDQQYFDGVPVIAWEFYIGGYQPAQKWLKDRHGRTLTFEDILHYQKIIVALTETHRIMQAIDDVLGHN
ncbi:type ISP restriction/modification enzyme [Methyloglobulus sp.]|uniref:type ISP restriction/modification enzyme n=1 Tax=Methyloglobulus sp. TaxID=2518622 RepID=UPI00398A48B3